ncbi:lysine-specific histone demethylase 1 homolog 3 isoform X1 [Cryptomeria japonica]|uniref:lysine-specific histone demethylase 1 homolog 3 isoform X1 n=2 Tax=Cryptomeria japonica TaxID=3369 RepID=UPI0027D9D751|nr:lysine-specific histone demethylase 1 homolog 3 isoform X1 [Cryptomeria japonica]XP_057863528.2 lysine-specific histone demethylase 1 homolog 3 isoform X1 [Cryptomeria japonica]
MTWMPNMDGNDGHRSLPGQKKFKLSFSRICNRRKQEMRDNPMSDDSGNGNSELGIENNSRKSFSSQTTGCMHASDCNGMDTVTMEDGVGLDGCDEMDDKQQEGVEGENPMVEIQADPDKERDDELPLSVSRNDVDGMRADQYGKDNIQPALKLKDIMDGMQDDADGEETLAKFKKPRRLRRAEVKAALEDDTGNTMEISKDKNQNLSLDDTVRESNKTPAKIKKPRRLKKGEVKENLEDDTVDMMGISIVENKTSMKDNTVREADAVPAKIKKPRRLKKGEVKDTLEDDTGNMVHLSRGENRSLMKDTTVIEADETPAKLENPRGLEKGEDKDMLEDDTEVMVEISRDENQNPVKERAAKEADDMPAKIKKQRKLKKGEFKDTLEADMGNVAETSAGINQSFQGNITEHLEDSLGIKEVDEFPSKKKRPRRLRKRDAKNGLETDVENAVDISTDVNQSLKVNTAQDLEDNISVKEVDEVPAKMKKPRRLKKREVKNDLEAAVENAAGTSTDMNQSLKGYIAENLEGADEIPAKTKKPRRLKKFEAKDSLESDVDNAVEISRDMDQSLQCNITQNSEDNIEQIDKAIKSSKTLKKMPKVDSLIREASTSENDIKEAVGTDTRIKRQKGIASSQGLPSVPVEKMHTGKSTKAGKLSDSNLEGLQKDAPVKVSDTDKGNKQLDSQRASRQVKKRKFGDMAYEGDSDWDVLINGEETNENKTGDKERLSKGRARGGLISSLLGQVVPGEETAVAAGLKMRQAGPAEKIRFKEVLKRRGGLQEYLDCRNSILWLWGKDVRRILPLSECGVSSVPLQDESPQDSLIRDIYNFLDYRGYINVGVAVKKEKAEADSEPKLKLSNECTHIEKLGDKVVDAEEEVAFILGQIKGSEENSVNGQNHIQGGDESQMLLPNVEESNKLEQDCSGLTMPERKYSDECEISLMEIDETPLVAQFKEGDTITGTLRSPLVNNEIESESIMPNKEKEELGTGNISGSGGTADQDSLGKDYDVKAETDSVVKAPSVLEQIKNSYDEDEFSDIDSAKVLHNLRKYELQTDSQTDKQEVNLNAVPEDKADAHSDLKDQKKIIVVGAGPAGLAAARHLQRLNFNVTVLEARDRVGGRVYTDRLSLSVPVDLGASIITGVEADVATERRPDPSALLCTQLGLELTVLNSECPLYDSVTGQKVPSNLDDALEMEYNSLLDDMVMLVAQNGDTAMRMSLEEGLEYALKKRRSQRSSTSYLELESNRSPHNDPDITGIVLDSSMTGLEALGGTADGSFTVTPEAESNVSEDVIAENGIEKDSSYNIIKSSSTSEQKCLSQLERRVMDWHFANLEYGCAAELRRVSLPYWNQDDAYGGFGGAHCMIKGGYSTVMEALAGGLNIYLSHIVTEIEYLVKDSNSKGEIKKEVKVRTANGREFIGDAVLITIPLGCLKANTVKFCPALPDWKLASIQRLGFGVLNKVVMEFPKVFWDESVDYFGATAESTDLRGRCFMFWNLKKTVGSPVLIALVVGKAAVDSQTTETSDHVQHAVMILRKLFGETVVPDPIASVTTNWGCDPFSRGAYSYVAVGASGEDYDILGRPVENCLFFAGEATCKEHPDTVGGAIMSGLREAVRIIDILENCVDSMAEAEAMAAAQRQSESERNEVRDIKKRLDAGELSSVLCKGSLDGEQKPLSKDALLQDMFGSAKTTSGRLHLAKEMLQVPAAAVKAFAGTKEGLSILNKWILDSMGKDRTQLLRHCVRLLQIVSTDMMSVRQSGIGRTVKQKVINHTSRDIRAVAKQLVNTWVELFRKEKANGGLKLLKQSDGPAKISGLSDVIKAKYKEQIGKLPNSATNGFKGNLVELVSVKDHSSAGLKNKNSELQSVAVDAGTEQKKESNFEVGQNCDQGQVDKLDDSALTEYEAAAIAAAEAARAAAIAAAEAYATEAECSSFRELPKIPSFHKFAKREQYVQKDDSEVRKKKWSGAVLGKQDSSEIDSRSCRVRNWSVDFAATCGNLDSSRVGGSDYGGGNSLATLDLNMKQRSQSNDIDSHSDLKERSAETGAVESKSKKHRVHNTGKFSGGTVFDTADKCKPYSLGSHSEILDQNIQQMNDKYSTKVEQVPINHSRNGEDEKCVFEGGSNKESPRTKSVYKDEARGSEHIKKGITDYVASLLMPLYKNKKIDRDGYKSIMKKSTIKVMEHNTSAENAMTVSEFLDIKRKNKIRSLVDKFIERYMANRQQ